MRDGWAADWQCLAEKGLSERNLQHLLCQSGLQIDQALQSTGLAFSVRAFVNGCLESLLSFRQSIQKACLIH